MYVAKIPFHDQRGAAFIWFALTLIPLVSVTGLAVDGGRVYLSQRSLQNAADAAALSAALGTADKRFENARTVAKANLPASFPFDPGNDTDLSVDGDRLAVTLKSTFTPSMLELIGFSEFPISATSVVTLGGGLPHHLELTLVLDNSGSMSQDRRLELLKTAAKNMISTLLGGLDENPRLRVNIVPFSGQVNVGRANIAFIDTAALIALNYEWTPREVFCPSSSANSSCAYQDDYADYCSDYGYTDAPAHPVFWDRTYNACFIGAVSSLTMSQRACENTFPYEQSELNRVANGIWDPARGLCIISDAWSGCVFARSDGEDVTDTPPTVENFRPFYANHYAYNVYFQQSDGSRATLPRGGWGWGPNLHCGAPIQTFLSRRSDIEAAIDSLVAAGPTHINQGLVWGWRTLSPRWRGAFASDTQYPGDYASNRLKVLVLLSDGANQIHESSSTAYGLGTQQQNTHLALSVSASNEQRKAALNTRTATLCGKLAEEKITVYSIVLALASGEHTARNLMRDCVGSPELFFDIARAQELDGIFQDIAQKILESGGKIRITR